MKKETIKSIILVLLIGNCLFLTFQIWFDRAIWGDEFTLSAFYNAAAELATGVFTQDGAADDSAPLKGLLSPRRVVINNVLSQAVYYGSDETYITAYRLFNELLAHVYHISYTGAFEISRQDYAELLSDKCVYIDFGTSINAELIANSIGGDGSFAFNAITDAVICGDESGNATVVAIRDKTSGTYYKYYTNIKSTVAERLIKACEGKKKTYEFAFEMNLDKVDSKFPNALRLDSFLLIPLTLESLAGVTVERGYFDNGEINANVCDEIVEAFGYRPSNLRKTVSASGGIGNISNVSYVENSGTISINGEGLVQYRAVNEDMGLNLRSQGAWSQKPAYNDALSAVLQLANDIGRIAGVTSNGETQFTAAAELTPSKTAIAKGDYEILLDYSVNGMPVKTNYAVNEALRGFPVSEMNSAVIAIVRNNIIVEFKMLIRGFIKPDNADIIQLEPLLTALDAEFPYKLLSKANICYELEKGSKTLIANWHFEGE